jgi:hypothetical protein
MRTGMVMLCKDKKGQGYIKLDKVKLSYIKLGYVR